MKVTILTIMVTDKTSGNYFQHRG